MRISGAIRSAFAGAALLAAGIAAGAQGPGSGPGHDMGGGFGQHRPPMEQAFGPRGAHGRWWNDPAMVEKLKLTDDQRKSMDAILLEHREKLIDMRANVEKAELAMEPLMHDDRPNEGQILAQIDKVAQARAELEKANARFLLAIRGKLTPDQWKQLQEAHNDRADRHGDRMDRRGWQQDGPRHEGPAHDPAPPPSGPDEEPQSMLQSTPVPNQTITSGGAALQ